MSQKIFPEADAYNGDGWLTGPGASVDLWNQINNQGEPEVSLETDNDWIWSPTLPAVAAYVTRLEDFLRPAVSLDENWTINIRMQKAISTPTQLDLKIQLRQFYVDEIDQGELLFEETIADIPFGYMDYVVQMPGLDPSTITPGEVYVRLEADTS